MPPAARTNSTAAWRRFARYGNARITGFETTMGVPRGCRRRGRIDPGRPAKEWRRSIESYRGPEVKHGPPIAPPPGAIRGLVPAPRADDNVRLIVWRGPPSRVWEPHV